MKKLKMQLFGEFSLTDGTVYLGEKELHSKKLMRLLAYFLINREISMTRQSVINTFWEDNSRNPESALRNQVHEIRNALKAFGDENFIKTIRGSYHWNPEIEVETDYELFEKQIERLQEPGVSVEEQIQICEKILSESKQITKLLEQEEWLFARKTYFQSAFEECEMRLCTLLEEKKEWDKLESLLEHMADRNSCLNVLSAKKSDISFVRKMLDEIPVDTETKGAYACDFQMFKQLYRIEARRIERTGIAEYILLFSLSRYRKPGSEPLKDYVIEEGMKLLEQVLCSGLRIGDVVSRYSESQIMALLPTCTYESSIRVAERLLKKYLSQCKERSLEVSYEIAEISLSA